MSRINTAAQQRNLSLTEELERLEQSITLTLQEIDHNFSKAHRIVTSSILPIVEQYASHSRDVWEGSKFWKQFFESSANVSLSGYEEQASQQEITEDTVTEETETGTQTTLEETSNSYETPSAQHISTSSIQDLDLSNLSISPSHSTPRPSKKQAQAPSFADYPSPYEALRQEVNNTTNIDVTSISRGNEGYPETPGRRNVVAEDVAMTPDSSPVLPKNPTPATTRPSTIRKKSGDPLLHKVLDKTYRIQATPLSKPSTHRPYRFANNTPGTATQTTRNPLLDSTLSSSPPVAPPQLHAELFNSPERKTNAQRQVPAKQQRTPGVSVLTPARSKNQNDTQSYTQPKAVNAWDDSDDDFDSEYDQATGMPYGAGMSPPKTMSFHVPQSRLLKTPAKEASKRIVNDILETAGVGRNGGQDDTDDLDIDLDIDIDLDADVDEDGARGEHEYGESMIDGEQSPSIVRRAVGIEDETF